VLDGVYRTTAGVPVFHAVRAPTGGELQVLLTRIIKRLMKFLMHKGFRIAEQGMTYLADPGPETALAPLQTRRASASTPRCAAPPMNASSWSICAATSPAPPSPTSD